MSEKKLEFDFKTFLSERGPWRAAVLESGDIVLTSEGENWDFHIEITPKVVIAAAVFPRIAD
jgi:alkylated DNA repair dioxygenase AlkB